MDINVYPFTYIYIYIYILELHNAYPCTFLCCSVIGLLGSPVGLAWVALIGLALIDQSKAALYSQVTLSWLECDFILAQVAPKWAKFGPKLV